MPHLAYRQHPQLDVCIAAHPRREVRQLSCQHFWFRLRMKLHIQFIIKILPLLRHRHNHRGILDGREVQHGIERQVRIRRRVLDNSRYRARPEYPGQLILQLLSQRLLRIATQADGGTLRQHHAARPLQGLR